jgi:hypothetical protein
MSRNRAIRRVATIVIGVGAWDRADQERSQASKHLERRHSGLRSQLRSQRALAATQSSRRITPVNAQGKLDPCAMRPMTAGPISMPE